jgi:hypothetical protein
MAIQSANAPKLLVNLLHQALVTQNFVVELRPGTMGVTQKLWRPFWTPQFSMNRESHRGLLI